MLKKGKKEPPSGLPHFISIQEEKERTPHWRRWACQYRLMKPNHPRAEAKYRSCRRKADFMLDDFFLCELHAGRIALQAVLSVYAAWEGTDPAGTDEAGGSSTGGQGDRRTLPSKG